MHAYYTRGKRDVGSDNGSSAYIQSDPMVRSSGESGFFPVAWGRGKKKKGVEFLGNECLSWLRVVGNGGKLCMQVTSQVTITYYFLKLN